MPLYPAHEALLDTASKLVDEYESESDLRKAVSTAYFAMFHCVAFSCANVIAGDPDPDADPSPWRHVYRAVEHRQVKDQCKQLRNFKLLPHLQLFADEFVRLQGRRHAADYDPYADFGYDDASGDVFMAAVSIDSFWHAAEPDRRSFVSWVMFRRRR